MNPIKTVFTFAALRTLAVVLALAALAAVLSGCASAPERVTVKPEFVAVPAQCPAPQIPAKPALPLADLPADATPAQTVSAYAKSLQACAEYTQRLLIILKAYQ